MLNARGNFLRPFVCPRTSRQLLNCFESNLDGWSPVTVVSRYFSFVIKYPLLSWLYHGFCYSRLRGSILSPFLITI